MYIYTFSHIWMDNIVFQLQKIHFFASICFACMHLWMACTGPKHVGGELQNNKGVLKLHVLCAVLNTA